MKHTPTEKKPENTKNPSIVEDYDDDEKWNFFRIKKEDHYDIEDAWGHR